MLMAQVNPSGLIFALLLLLGFVVGVVSGLSIAVGRARQVAVASLVLAPITAVAALS